MRIKNQGFSLIEVMVVVAIIAIIAAIAVPAYQKQVQKTHRKAVQEEILEIAGQLENNFLQNGAYNGTFVTQIVGATNGLPSDSGRYQLSVFRDRPNGIAFVDTGDPQAPDLSQTFVITATPIIPAQLSDRCGVLIMDNFNIKSAQNVNNGGAIQDCW